MHLIFIPLKLEYKAAFIWPVENKRCLLKSHFQDADECWCRWAECTQEAGHRTEGDMQNNSKNTPDALR